MTCTLAKDFLCQTMTSLGPVWKMRRLIFMCVTFSLHRWFSQSLILALDSVVTNFKLYNICSALTVHCHGMNKLVPTMGAFSLQHLTPTRASFAWHIKFAKPPLMTMETHLDVVIKRASATLGCPQSGRWKGNSAAEGAVWRSSGALLLKVCAATTR